MTREDSLHTAVCQAVTLLNRSPGAASCFDGREARDLLRQALVDYANAQPLYEVAFEMIYMPQSAGCKTHPKPSSDLASNRSEESVREGKVLDDPA